MREEAAPGGADPRHSAGSALGFAGLGDSAVLSLPTVRELRYWFFLASQAIPSALAGLQAPQTQMTEAAPDCQYLPHEQPWHRGFLPQRSVRLWPQG